MAQTEMPVETARLCYMIDGVENAEDIARIPGMDWLITSAYSDREIPDARPRFVHIYSQEVLTAFPDRCVFAPDKDRYPISEPPLGIRFHGLDVSVLDGKLVWLQINHRNAFGTSYADGRESVEIFEIEVDREKKPVAIWRGAVPIPEWAFGNDVCALPDGGFALTSTYFVGGRPRYGFPWRVFRSCAGMGGRSEALAHRPGHRCQCAERDRAFA